MFLTFGSIKTNIRISVLNKEDKYSRRYVYFKSPVFINSRYVQQVYKHEGKSYRVIGYNVPYVGKVYYNKFNPSISYYMSGSNVTDVEKVRNYHYSKYLEISKSIVYENSLNMAKIFRGIIDYLTGTKNMNRLFMYQDFIHILKYMSNINYNNMLEVYDFVGNINNIIKLMHIGKPKILSVNDRLILYSFELSQYEQYDGLSNLLKSMFSYNKQIKNNNVNMDIIKESINIYKVLKDEDVDISNLDIYSVYFTLFKDFVLDLNFFSYIYISGKQKPSSEHNVYVLIFIKITDEDKKIFVYKKHELENESTLLKVIELNDKQIKHIKRQQHLYQGKIKL